MLNNLNGSIVFLIYLKLFFFVAVTCALITVLYVLWLVIAGLKQERYTNRHNFKVYEFGTTTIGSSQRLSHSDFFLLSALFIIFDVELLFMFLWISGLSFSSHLVYKYSFFAFITLLFVGLGYELVNGVLLWYRLKR